MGAFSLIVVINLLNSLISNKMGTSSSTSSSTTSLPSANDSSKPEFAKTPEELAEGKPRCKSCCACPDTRKLRDECVATKGIDNCQEFIDAHNKCMEAMGFNMGTK